MRDFEKSLEKTLKRVMDNPNIRKKNKEIILKFTDQGASMGYSVKRVLKYVQYLSKLSIPLNVDFEKAGSDDLKRLAFEIDRMYSNEYTKYDAKVMLKRFYKWLNGDEDYPKCIRWLKPRIKLRDKKLPEELLTVSEVKQLIEKATHMRDRAFVSVLYESGCRISEIIDMKVKHVTFDDYGTIIRVTGKTGSRRIRLISSSPYLSNWIAHHPSKSSNSHLWVCIGNRNHNKLIEYNTIRNLLKELAKECNIDKRVNPHTFRHSRATALASKLTEAQMCEYFGWSRGSNMPATYVHLSGRDIDNAILEIHGIKRPKDDKSSRELEPKKCPRCFHTNEATINVCSRCGLPLDTKTALGYVNTSKNLEMLIEKKVEEMLKKN